MSRKKIVNKEKFEFREEEVLPPRYTKSRNSFQSRLVKKSEAAGGSSSCGGGTMDHHTSHSIQGRNINRNEKAVLSLTQTMTTSPTPVRGHDPVLDEIVAKLKSGLQLRANNAQSSFFKNKVGVAAAVVDTEEPGGGKDLLPRVNVRRPAADCLCHRALKLVMCEVCGETFRGRVSRECPIHPRALYLQDVKECRGCRQSNKEALKEFDLPPGMEKMMKRIGVNINNKVKAAGNN